MFKAIYIAEGAHPAGRLGSDDAAGRPPEDFDVLLADAARCVNSRVEEAPGRGITMCRQPSSARPIPSRRAGTIRFPMFSVFYVFLDQYVDL